MDFKEKQKAEAVARMQLFGMFPEIISQFRNDGLISASEPPFGACFWLDEEQMGRVRCFEEDNNAVVYHVIPNKTEVGHLESYLFVTKYYEEWETDFADISKGKVLAYVRNIDYPDCSEFGYIGVELSPAAGLTRIW